MNKCLLSFFLLLMLPNISKAQQNIISGIINSYTKVTGISASLDVITVKHPALFKSGDTVLIIQMKGADYSSSGGIQNINGAGLYEFTIINKIISNSIYFSSALSRSYTPAIEPVQLIKVPSFKYATINDTVKCPAWSGDSTGGIVALIANDSLILNGSIKANQAGFHGGITSFISLGNCGKEVLFLSKPDSAGTKGDGIVKLSDTLRYGEGMYINGGGGGNGKLSGGGGGGNLGSGGYGGDEMAPCSQTIGGYGGFIATKLYSDTSIYSAYRKRIYFGGGGGSGTQIATGTSSAGGNGGGIVILLTAKLISNSGKIYANGGSVTASASGAGGGGGAGGTIVLDVNKYSGSLSVFANGGTGGSTSSAGGPGGGGGGGFLWYSGSSHASDIVFKAAGGASGYNSSSSAHGATSGSANTTLQNNLVVPLSGFLFNTISPATQTKCYGDTATLAGSTPKGGNGKFKFHWLQKTGSTGWVFKNNGKDASQDYMANPIDTTLYRRVVISKGIIDTTKEITDTSMQIMVKVVPEIKHNVIYANQTICNADKASLLTGDSATGGNDTLAYLWEKATTLGNWSSIGTSRNYDPGTLYDTTYYRRKVLSTICTHISDTLTITVLAKITNNTISPNQNVCYNTTPKKLEGLHPIGGDKVSYVYQWQTRVVGTNPWSSVSGTGTQMNYSLGALTDTINRRIEYRRIVFSGLNNCCKDTSNKITTFVLNSIKNNSIYGNDTMCEGFTPIAFTGTIPTGGDTAFRYKWISGTVLDTLNSAPSANSANSYQSSALYKSTFFRRIVYSTPDDSVCTDTSNYIETIVHPSINNNVLFNKDTTICTGSTPFKIAGKQVTGGIGIYSYQWNTRKTSSLWIFVNGAVADNFSPGALTDTVLYMRMVTSGKCIDSTAIVVENVLQKISNNSIPTVVMDCYNSPVTITGSVPTGGDPAVYRYLWNESSNATTWDTAVNEPDLISYTSDTLQTTRYYKRIVKSGTSLYDCCFDTSNMATVQINPLPTGSMDDLADTLCNDQSRNITLHLTGTSPWDIVYYDSHTNNSLTGISQATYEVTVDPAVTSTYTLNYVKDGNNCVATDTSGQAYLFVYDRPAPNAGVASDTCGAVYRLKAISSSYTGTWSSVDSANFLDGKDNRTSQVQVPEYGSHIFTWTEQNGICYASDSVEITFYEPPSAFAGNDTVVHFIFSYQLNATDPTVGTGLWTKQSGTGYILNPTDHDSEVDSLHFDDNIFVWTVTNGTCPSVSDTVVITVKNIAPPTGFTPGHQKNSCFVIPGIENTEGNNELVIFNRWGSEIYRRKSYDNSWNGNDDKGNELPDDTYFYVLYVEGKFSYNGFVVIKR